MTQKNPSYGFNRTSVEAFSHFNEEPAWLREQRLAAWEIFEEGRNSSVGDELTLDGLQSFSEPPTRAVPPHEWPPDLPHALEERGDEEGLIIQRDSTILSRSISKEQAKRGVLFTDLATAVKIAPDIVQRYLGRLAKVESTGVSLNSAFWAGGTFLYIPQHVEIHLPFHTCLWMSTAETAAFPRAVIVVEKGSKVSLLDESFSPNRHFPSLCSGVTELWVGEGAQVQLFQLRSWGEEAVHLSDQEYHVAGTGRLMVLSISTGGVQARGSLCADLLNRQGSTERYQSEKFSLETDEYSQARPFFEDIFQPFPRSALVEKLRHFVGSKFTGQRPALTLHQVAELHPEVRA